MAKRRIIRDKAKARAARRHRFAGGLALVAAVTSWVVPLEASRPSPSSLTVMLDDPKPIEGADDLANILGVTDPAAAQSAGYPSGFDPAAMTTAGVDPNAVLPPEPFAMPQSFAAGPAATPYHFRGRSATDTLRATMCLTAAIYYEAANEPDAGQAAVAQVVLNRVRHPAYPNTVCDVVYQGTERNDTLCQFTFGCDGALSRRPTAAGWARARRVAAAALNGAVFAPVGMATHYHTLAVSPVWNKSLVATGVFGAHIFFRWPGGAGAPAAFRSVYTGREPFPGPRPKANPLPPLIMAQNGALPFPQTTAPGTLPVFVPTPSTQAGPAVAAITPNRSVAADKRYLPGALPESDVNPAYRNSGEWIVRPR